MRLITVILLFLCSCSLKPSYQLKWEFISETPHKYRATIAYPIPEKYLIQKNVFELESDKTALIAAINSLKTIPLTPGTMPLITTITKLETDDTLEIKMLVGKFEYKTPPKDEMEETKRKIESQSEGMIQLFTHTDSSGVNKSFFLKQVQKNLVAIMFQLPQKPISVGEQWSLPTNLIEIGNGFVPKNSKILNKVWVQSTYDDPQLGTVAEIVYLIGEYVAGNFIQTTKTMKPTPPFEMSFSYVAFGEYLVDKGQWKRYAGQMSTKSSGSVQLNSNKLYSLYPVD